MKKLLALMCFGLFCLNANEPRIGGGITISKLDTSFVPQKFLNLPYASKSEAQKLDLYLPKRSNQPYAVIVVFHGGGFMMGDKAMGEVQGAIDGVKRGYAVISANYRLSGEATFPSAINDAKSVIRWVRANAKTYNLDADKIVVWGGSAGGNIASMVGVTGDLQAIGENDNMQNLEYSSKVQVVIDWFGPLDFLSMDTQFKQSSVKRRAIKGSLLTSDINSPESKYIGKLITLEPTLTQKANPASYLHLLTPSNAPYFFIEHGDSDTLVPTQQSIDFANLLEKHIGSKKVKLEILKGADHGSDEFDSKENLDKVYDFIAQALSTK